jgi:hypothetical protein
MVFAEQSAEALVDSVTAFMHRYDISLIPWPSFKGSEQIDICAWYGLSGDYGMWQDFTRVIFNPGRKPGSPELESLQEGTLDEQGLSDNQFKRGFIMRHLTLPSLHEELIEPLAELYMRAEAYCAGNQERLYVYKPLDRVLIASEALQQSVQERYDTSGLVQSTTPRLIVLPHHTLRTRIQ